MPNLSAVSVIKFPNQILQEDVKQTAQSLFTKSFPQIERMMSAFDNTEIVTRNFAQPLSYYTEPQTFRAQNELYIRLALQYSVQAIEDCVTKAGIQKEEITDIVFVSTTGLATPSIDAMIINKMKLNPYVNRTPIFGLGCAGGVGGFAKANTIAVANKKAVVLLVAAEFCSLTFLRNDFSKSNFIGSSLFADGVAACILVGDDFDAAKNPGIRILTSRSKLYYDTLDVMGWDFMAEGFKVVFSKDIPTIISENIRKDVDEFLALNGLELSDINNFIFHPGGKKVLSAYEEALKVEGDFLKNTRTIMNENGNMSAPTVLYVLEKFYTEKFEAGYGLMVAMGPGFSSEMVLLKTTK